MRMSWARANAAWLGLAGTAWCSRPRPPRFHRALGSLRIQNGATSAPTQSTAIRVSSLEVPGKAEATGNARWDAKRLVALLGAETRNTIRPPAEWRQRLQAGGTVAWAPSSLEARASPGGPSAPSPVYMVILVQNKGLSERDQYNMRQSWYEKRAPVSARSVQHAAILVRKTPPWRSLFCEFDDITRYGDGKRYTGKDCSRRSASPAARSCVRLTIRFQLEFNLCRQPLRCVALTTGAHRGHGSKAPPPNTSGYCGYPPGVVPGMGKRRITRDWDGVSTMALA